MEDDPLKNYKKSLETTTYYQIGKIVAEARLSMKSAIKAPFEVYKTFKRYKRINQTNPHAPTQPANHFQATPLEHAFFLLREKSNDAYTLKQRADKLKLSPHDHASTMLTVGKVLAKSDAHLANEILDSVNATDPSTQKDLAFAYYQAGALIQANSLLDQSSVENCLSREEKLASARIKDEAVLLQKGIDVPAIPPNNLDGKNKKILLVSHLSLPHNNTGYAIRTHHVALSLKQLGYDIHCVTRPGYPWDRRDATNLEDAQAPKSINGIEYYCLAAASSKRLPLSSYFSQAKGVLYNHIVEHQITHVIAASNYVNGIPALLAARHAGVKFLYDVRGLWEYSDASNIKNWEYTERFNLSKRLETLIAEKTDNVLVNSTSLKNELVSRGISNSKIEVALNGSCDTNHSLKERDLVRKKYGIPADATVLGYIGSIEKYEGLDILLKAAKPIIEKNTSIYLLIVGDGSHYIPLQELCYGLGISRKTRFTGRVNHQKAIEYYSAIDICVYPRLADKVCRIVAPLKPLEAMRHRVAIVHSKLPPLEELLGEENTVSFESGDIKDLTSKLEPLTISTELRMELAAKSERFAVKHRSWTHTAKAYAKAIDNEK